jgi:protein-disulfide isomerase
LLAATACASAPAREPSQAPVATVGGEVISRADLERSAAVELASVDQEYYRVLERKLSDMIAERLLAREAQRRGLTVEALLQEEVTAKIPAVTDADVQAYITQNRARIPRGREAEFRSRIVEILRGEQATLRREAYLASLRIQTPVQTSLEPPPARRVPVDPGQGYARGYRDAPITIVAFTDFRCPYCNAVEPTLKQLVARHSDRVRLVFRDFPIAGLHPDAPLAHEAARCAGDQGKFWPYHDLLFERAPDVSVLTLKRFAAEVGADRATFDQCLESRKHRAEVTADVQAGTTAGVTVTPTFFVNGAVLVGEQSLEDFERVIDRELARAASRH